MMVDVDWDAAREAGRLYRSTGALSDRLLRSDILHAWERCHELHIDPQKARAPVLEADDAARLIASHAPLLAAAEPYLRALSQASGAHSHAAVLGDTRAVVLAAVGDEHAMATGEYPGPGVLMDEASAGVNGVGTPLVEGKYVEIVGPEHFIEGFCETTCQGIPLRDGTGAVVATLATSVRRREVSLRLREMLVCAAHGIEAELLHASLEARLARVLADPSPSHEVLERLHLDLTQKQASARMRVELASQQLGRGQTVSATDVLQLAQRALEGYRRQATFWRLLASPEGARSPRPVALDEAVRDLAILLEGEAASLECELLLREIEPATVVADPVAVRSALFRAFLAAIARARGGAVLVDVRRERGTGVASLSPQPGPGVVLGAAAPVTVTAPAC
jgi:transcriptional regulator of acetoin/glycerol metabolism